MLAIKRKYFTRNVIITVLGQISAVSNFFLLSYLVNSFEQIYTTAILYALSQTLGFTVSGWLLERFGVRKCYLIASALAVCGGLSIIFYGL